MRKFITLLFLLFYPFLGYSHSGVEHVNQMMAVLGFEQNNEIWEWLYFISHNIIDMVDPEFKFEKTLSEKHPGFSCNHRFLFHWAYRAEPWSDELTQKVKKYCKDAGISNVDSVKFIIKEETRNEQARRNREMNRRAEKLFGFDSHGTEASWANILCSIAYNTHLIGDYEFKNSEGGLQQTDGMQELDKIVGYLGKDIMDFDLNLGKPIKKKLDGICKKYGNSKKDNARKAEEVLNTLMEEVPILIQKTQGGSIKRRLEARGFKFVKIK